MQSEHTTLPQSASSPIPSAAAHIVDVTMNQPPLPNHHSPNTPYITFFSIRTPTSPCPPPPPAFTPSPSPPPPPPPRSASQHVALSKQDRSPSDMDPTHSVASLTPSPIDDESALLDHDDTGSSLLASASSARKPKPKAPLQLVMHLPLAEDAAMATFQHITFNDYHDKKLGRPPGKFDDYMICDCNPNTHNEDMACTDYSGCINRMTQIECSSSKCRWGKLCRNQRFHRRQYVNVDIVQTERKGFGLRAAQDIPKETFVYEYVGEVMNQPTFLERMHQYRLEGIRHFYFMMLQPNEYLDATKKGGKGRFINHSCNPNCSVSKWQECFCGEPNCVGTLGGKTQTDLSGMDDLFLDALGISDEVEQTEAKGSRRKRGKRLDLDFIPKMRPIQEHEATRVMTAARQAGPKREILEKLLRRMEMTTDVNVQKSLVKLHGFILMQFLLEQWWNDRDIVLLIINVLARWPLIARNKSSTAALRNSATDGSHDDPSSDVKPNGEVKSQASQEGGGTTSQAIPMPVGAPPAPDAEVSSRAEHLLEAWKKLDMTYRIARKDALKQGADDKDSAGATTWIDRRRLQDLDDPLELDDAQAPNANNMATPTGTSIDGKQSARQADEWLRSPRASPGTFTPTRLNSSGQSPLTPDQVTSALSSSLAKSLPGLVSSIKQHQLQMQQQQHQQPQQQPQPVAPPTKSIEDIIREANEQEERARKEAEAAAKAARELELNGVLSSSSSRKRPSSSSRHSDKRHKHSSSFSHSASKHAPSNGLDANRSAVDTSSNTDSAELAASNERKLRKLVGEIVVRQMSKHKDALERESFKRHAKELTNAIVGKEMRNPKSWPPARGAALTELSKEKAAKVKSFAKEYIDKLMARKAKDKGSTPNEGGSSQIASNGSA
ncbi:related to SET2 - Histone methyltransferase [Ustilago trichophora]|uniref:[histone H3]-lysine(36) N-trimethyltransferase n=1 Tax=Ustilago trichophora TaxID=86804 RepID=A0A5C3E6B7_9BASI|nr:related to SET2 - Histone methyltransferase [Ustilago trichophora]